MYIPLTNLKKYQRNLPQERNILSLLLVVTIFGFLVTSAWATLSFVKPQDASRQIEESKISEIVVIPDSSKPRSRAPEPATIVLFGGGLLGMAASFIRKTYAVVKRVFDILISLIALVLLSPFALLAMLLIKLTSNGPIFFTQTRVGKNGEPFQIYKFRTMRVDAEKDTGPVWATANDRRLIPGGKFLRKAHIDEIPQFINVLQGEMSVVGPRPERPVFVEQFKKVIPDYEKRIMVKPGITGLAQVWHKYDESIQDVKKKVKYDLLYIRKLCLWTDLGILLRTVRVVFTGEGAR